MFLLSRDHLPLTLVLTVEIRGRCIEQPVVHSVFSLAAAP